MPDQLAAEQTQTQTQAATEAVPPVAPPAPPILFNDDQVLDFIVNGYALVQPEFPDGFNEAIDRTLTAMKGNPGNAILEAVPALNDVYSHPKVRGALISLMGADYKMSGHRHWHCRPPGPWSQGWHQDSVNSRHHRIPVVLGLYYPHDVTLEMGPTVIVPGSQFRNCPTDRMATYGNIRGQLPIVVKAGTVAITHYDIWHGGSINRSDRPRHMLKFLFSRGSEPTEASWDHNPETAGSLAANKLSFENPSRCGQSDHYKERVIRNEAWTWLLGGKKLVALPNFGDRTKKAAAEY
jgi:hypothetical protein